MYTYNFSKSGPLLWSSKSPPTHSPTHPEQSNTTPKRSPSKPDNHEQLIFFDITKMLNCVRDINSLAGFDLSIFHHILIFMFLPEEAK